MTDGPGSVSTLILILVVVGGTKEGRGEVLFPEKLELGGLGTEGVPEWVGGKGEGSGEKGVDKVESEGTADARAATMRVRTAEVHMNA
jgi:hypothetical protein